MAIRTILHYPDERLRRVGEKVVIFDAELARLLDDMAETMYAAPGVGLAATQVGVARQVFVIDIAGEDEPSQLREFINPEIVEKTGKIIWEEGCLSFPEAREEIERAAYVKVRAWDRHGKPFELEGEELLAVAIQHEYDHLQGVLMIDLLSVLKKRLLGRKMKRRAEERASPG